MKGLKGVKGVKGVRGFTLIELVVVILITAILATLSAVVLRPALAAYLDVRNRAATVDEAQAAMQMIAQDVRAAVPNSLRSPGALCVEAIPTSTGGAYRLAGDSANDLPADCTASATCSAPLDTAGATTVFDVLSALSKTPAVGDSVVIGNQDPSQVYLGSNRAVITAVATPRPTDGTLRLSVAPTQFPIGYAEGRFNVVAQGVQAVTYACDGADGTLDAQGNGKGVLYRRSAYGFSPSISSCPSGAALAGAGVVARNVRSCTFVYSPNQGNTQQNGLLSLQLEMTRNNETVTLSGSVNVANVP